MLKHILTNAKAYAALVGSVVSALLATAAPGSTLFTVLTAASVILTAASTWRVRNLTDAATIIKTVDPGAAAAIDKVISAVKPAEPPAPKV